MPQTKFGDNLISPGFWGYTKNTIVVTSFFSPLLEARTPTNSHAKWDVESRGNNRYFLLLHAA